MLKMIQLYLMVSHLKDIQFFKSKNSGRSKAWNVISKAAAFQGLKLVLGNLKIKYIKLFVMATDYLNLFFGAHLHKRFFCLEKKLKQNFGKRMTLVSWLLDNLLLKREKMIPQKQSSNSFFNKPGPCQKRAIQLVPLKLSSNRWVVKLRVTIGPAKI